MGVSKRKVFTNLIWRFAERCGAQGVAFIVSIVLARLLSPEAYGTIALVTVFTTVLQVFVDSGLGSALIQKKDADDLDFSTVFYFNIFLCSILYVGMFFAAPLIAKFYEMPELVPVVRVLSLTIVVSGLKNVQQAYISKTLQFKRFFYSSLSGTIGAAVVGITMAYFGFGVWALVAQQLFNVTVNTVVLWFTVKWRPRLIFSFIRLKSLFSFGWKLLVSTLIDTLYNDIRQLIIGKVYSSTDLAHYNKGKQFPNLIVVNINLAIDSVLFPVMSGEQDDRDRVKALTRRAIKTSSFIIWPIVIGLAACAESFVSIVLTDKWLPCVPYLQIFCVTFGFWPIHTANLNAIKAMGRSDIFLKLEIIKKAIGVVSIIASVPFGVKVIAGAFLITSPLNAFVNAFPNKKLLGYSYFEQIKDMLPSMLLSLAMALVVYCLYFLNLNIYLCFGLQIVVGVVVYVLGAKIFKFDSLEYVLNIFKKKN